MATIPEISLARFQAVSADQSSSKKVVLNKDGSDLATIGRWERLKNCFTVSRATRQQQNRKLAASFLAALKAEYGTGINSKLHDKLSKKAISLSARKITSVIKQVRNEFNSKNYALEVLPPQEKELGMDGPPDKSNQDTSELSSNVRLTTSEKENQGWLEDRARDQHGLT